MACATLKRTLDWDTMNQRPSKRRRCNPFEQSTSRIILNSQSSRGRVIPIPEPKISPFSEADVSAISPSKMSQSIRDEIKRLHKRKQLPFSAATIERMQDSESSGSEMGPDSPRRPETPPNITRNPDRALFTFKQVQLICERMLKEREEELREKYDDVLNTKLAEQYDAFVKFTYDQIHKRYEAAPSYLS